jgi:hypothetical protein
MRGPAPDKYRRSAPKRDAELARDALTRLQMEKRRLDAQLTRAKRQIARATDLLQKIDAELERFR